MTTQRRSAEDRNHMILSVVGVFAVLEVFGASSAPLSFAQIVRESRRPKGSIHRILSTLLKLDVIAKTDDDKYKLTFKLWGLGSAACQGLDLLKIAQPEIEALMRDAQETAHLAVLDGIDCATYLCKAESPQMIRAQFWVGKRVSSWRSASGRSMLAFLPEQELLASKLSSHISDAEIARLRDTLQRIRDNGYALTVGDNDNHPDLAGIAAPVRDHSGNVVASCGLTVPRFRISDQLIEISIPLVLNAAQGISAALGYRG